MTSSEKFELYVKSLLEPIVIHHMYIVNEFYANRPPHTDYEGAALVVGGGDCLNYYLPANKQILTHDFDLRLLRLGTPFTRLPYDCDVHVEQIMTYFVDRMNEFISSVRLVALPYLQQMDQNTTDPTVYKNIVNTVNLNFRYVKSHDYLHTIRFNYFSYDDPTHQTRIEASVIDLLVYVSTLSEHMREPIEENLRVTERDNAAIKEWIKQNYALIMNQTKNVVKDKKTGLYYIPLGDMLNDTARMMIFSLSQPANSGKIYRYIKKYVNFILALNDMISDFRCDELSNNIRVCENIARRSCQTNKELGVNEYEQYHKSVFYYRSVLHPNDQLLAMITDKLSYFSSSQLCALLNGLTIISFRNP
jgi:hypothetical protein